MIANTAVLSMAAHISIKNATAEKLAIEFLKRGSVIAVPTDTVYGLACDATNVSAIGKLYSIKCRNENKPLAICLSKVSDIKAWANVHHLPQNILTALLPGPVTIILQSTNNCLDKSLVSKGKVGIRIPHHNFIRNLACGLGQPLTLTSANLSNEPSAVEVSEFCSIWEKLPAIFDGGKLKSMASNKDDIIKQALTSQLSNSVKEIQYAGIDDNRPSNTNDIVEASNTLCNVLEAIFLHGLRDTLTHRFKRALADLDEQPEPSFWPPLLVISHRQIIDQITDLSQITSEVGQCRAWIRLALNDCLLSSYLMTMRLDSSALKSYYKVDAYIRDSELLDVAQRLIEGVEAFKTFTLPFNSSLLNSWPLPSLILAGIWSPTLKTAPVAPCDDVALGITEATIVQNIIEGSSETASLSSAMSITSQGSGLRQFVTLTEDEVLKIILDKDKQKVTDNKLNIVDDYKPSISSDQERSSDSDNAGFNIGNSLNKRSGWSFDETEVADEKEKKETNRAEKIEVVGESKSMEASYNALIESYNMLSGGFIRTPDIREVWQKFEDERNYVSANSSTVGQSETHTIISSVHLAKSETTALAVQIGRIAREKGLDNQNYECADCKCILAITNKSTVCAFTGEYFCDNCMSSESVQIPARIVHNWDFKTYPISRKGKKYIEEVKDHPILDFKVNILILLTDYKLYFFTFQFSWLAKDCNQFHMNSSLVEYTAEVFIPLGIRKCYTKHP
ncbi:unnamed protein product [Phaedon cochleariae]|uniref:Threonylcarbamoyl-AMP synthase n=1 Tax=Phaedon cochleariae TaxID=80249 RepID=A0A9N9SGX7_PHACE|nr:unnamed protein product [Phaedon cochleariae]